MLQEIMIFTRREMEHGIIYNYSTQDQNRNMCLYAVQFVSGDNALTNKRFCPY